MGYPYVLAPHNPSQLNLAVQSTMRIDADTERFAFKFYARTTSPITHVSCYLDINGTVTGVNFQMEIQTDSSDAPSGTPVGTATAAFAGLAADGWTGPKALASNTGALTIGTPYWLVFSRASGDSLSAAVWVQPARGHNDVIDRDKIRHFNGTDWTTTTALSAVGAYLLTHLDGSVRGIPLTVLGPPSASAADDIFGTTRQGLRLKVGSQSIVRGLLARVTKTGSPSDLTVKVYEGTTLKSTRTVPAAEITSGVDFAIWFGADGAAVAGDAFTFIILQQAADGGDAANDYDVRDWTVDATYINALAPPDWRFVHGTGDDPTALTVSTTSYPYLFPIIEDPAVDFDGASAGGGSRGFGMTGGMV